MGRSRRGSHRANLEDLIWDERHPATDPHNEPRSRVQPPRGPRDNSQRFHNPLERRQQPRNRPWSDSHHANSSRPNSLQKAHRVNQACVIKSKRLKEYLVRSLNAALNQIEQWYPEAGEDEMEWQHEEEVVVKQPQEAACTWATAPQGGGRASLKVAGDDVPRRISFSKGLQAIGFGDGQQWSSSDEEDCCKEVFRKGGGSTPDLSGTCM
ncbi:hypothetical protein IFR05_001904 [Cadophora sp. M221]|nr:hypothetical protein IFR05_001904 [Cadophora sp. M221]